MQDDTCTRISGVETLSSASRAVGVDLDERWVVVFAPLFNLFD